MRHSINALIMADYVFQVISAIKRNRKLLSEAKGGRAAAFRFGQQLTVPLDRADHLEDVVRHDQCVDAVTHAGIDDAPVGGPMARGHRKRRRGRDFVIGADLSIELSFQLLEQLRRVPTAGLSLRHVELFSCGHQGLVRATPGDRRELEPDQPLNLGKEGPDAGSVVTAPVGG